MSHGASKFLSNIPSLSWTQQYLTSSRNEASIRASTIFLFEHNNYVTSPGEHWIAGSALAGKSNITTKLLSNGKPARVERGRLGGTRSGI